MASTDSAADAQAATATQPPPASATSDKPVNIPDTTAPQVAGDVQKVALVTPGAEQPVDRKRTREAIEQDRAQAAALAARRSPAAILDASGLVFNDDPLTNKRWVGPKVKDDEVGFSGSRGVHVQATPLSLRRPERGLMVVPVEGEPFQVPEGVDDWREVMRPDGTPLIPRDDPQASAAAGEPVVTEEGATKSSGKAASKVATKGGQ
jgi:hypothetical protein